MARHGIGQAIAILHGVGHRGPGGGEAHVRLAAAEEAQRAQERNARAKEVAELAVGVGERTRTDAANTRGALLGHGGRQEPATLEVGERRHLAGGIHRARDADTGGITGFERKRRHARDSGERGHGCREPEIGAA